MDFAFLIADRFSMHPHVIGSKFNPRFTGKPYWCLRLKRYHVNFFSLFHGDKLFLEFSGFEKRERFRKKSIEFPIKIYFVYQGLRLSKLNFFPISYYCFQ